MLWVILCQRAVKSRKTCFAQIILPTPGGTGHKKLKTNDIKNKFSLRRTALLVVTRSLCVSGLTSFGQESTEAGVPSSLRTQLRTRVETPRT